MNAKALLDEAKQRGVKVDIFDGKLTAIRSPGLTPDFSATLREHSLELLVWFNTEHAVKQILCGEFTGCDTVTAAKLVRVLKKATHPLSHRALEHLLHDA